MDTRCSTTVLPSSVWGVLLLAGTTLGCETTNKVKLCNDSTAEAAVWFDYVGDPGWRVLSRGYQDLLLLARGWTEAMAAAQAKPIGH